MERRQCLLAMGSIASVSLSGCTEFQETANPMENERSSSSCSGETACPDVSVTPEQPLVGEQVVFDATGSEHPTGDQLSYFWTDPDYDDFYNEGPTYQTRFKSEGMHAVEVWMGTETVTSDEFSIGYGLDGTAPDSIRESILIEVEELSGTGIDVGTSDVNIHLSGDTQSAQVGDNATLSFSATNLIGNKSLTIQLIMQIPSGLIVEGASFDEGGGQFTSEYEIAGGDTVSDTIRVEGRDEGRYILTGDAVYYFSEDDRQSVESNELELHFFE